MKALTALLFIALATCHPLVAQVICHNTACKYSDYQPKPLPANCHGCSGSIPPCDCPSCSSNASSTPASEHAPNHYALPSGSWNSAPATAVPSGTNPSMQEALDQFEDILRQALLGNAPETVGEEDFSGDSDAHDASDQIQTILQGFQPNSHGANDPGSGDAIQNALNTQLRALEQMRLTSQYPD